MARKLIHMNREERQAVYEFVISNWDSMSKAELAHDLGIPEHSINYIATVCRKTFGIPLKRKSLKGYLRRKDLVAHFRSLYR